MAIRILSGSDIGTTKYLFGRGGILAS